MSTRRSSVARATRAACLLLVLLVLLFAVGLVATLAVGSKLTAPVLHSVGPPPGDLPLSVVRIAVPGASAVSGWFARGHPGVGSVLLLHGVRSDRRQMLGRARFLHDAGYSVLMIDLQAHGESPGDRITFGARESSGVEAALDWLRAQLPGERVDVIGVSLGAASIALARPRLPPDAVVLESMYPTLRDAVADRLAIRLGSPGRALAPALLWQVPLRLGIPVERLQPIRDIARLRAPVLIASGTWDQHTTWAETTRVYDAAACPKSLWAVEGAEHVDLYDAAPEAYRARILAFLANPLAADCEPAQRARQASAPSR